MENWALQDSSDTASGSVDNVQLFWKIQALQSLGIATDQDSTTSNASPFAGVTSEMAALTNDDVQREVDKLFQQPVAYDNDMQLVNAVLQLDDDTLGFSPTVCQDLPRGSVSPQSARPKRSLSPSPHSLTEPPRIRQRVHAPDWQQDITLGFDTTPSRKRSRSPVIAEASHARSHLEPVASANLNMLPQAIPVSLTMPTMAPPLARLQPDPISFPLPVNQQSVNETINTEPRVTEPKVTLRRPQLRVHVQASTTTDEVDIRDRDPMRPHLDAANLRRLTIAVLRAVGVTATLEELMHVNIDEPTSQDAQIVLHVRLMQIIVAMILGTSGDKDVSETVGSQISNGDLVALQRLVISCLQAKGYPAQANVPTPVLTARSIQEPRTPVESPAPTDTSNDGFLDLSGIQFQMPTTCTRLFLRLYRFILNTLLATPDCWPFIQPVPPSAFVYHQEIHHPMDLSTVEENIWQGKYHTFAMFEQDVKRIWENARTFHRNTGTIPRHADKLEALFRTTVQHTKKQSRQRQTAKAPQHGYFDPTRALPEECKLHDTLLQRLFSRQSTVYTISAMSPFESKALQPRGIPDDKLLYLQLNGPFFQAVQRMKADPTGTHSIIPRFYIAKNRTLLRQVSATGVLAIFHSITTKRGPKPRHYKIEADVIVAYPVSDIYDITQLNDVTDANAPKAWIHLRPLRILERVQFDVNETVERDYFRRMYATAKLPPLSATTSAEDVETRSILNTIARTVLSLPENTVTPATQPIKTEPTSSDTRTPIVPSSDVAVKEEETPQPMQTTKVKEETDSNNAQNKVGAVDTKGKSLVKHKNNVKRPKENVFAPRPSLRAQEEISHDVWKALIKVCMDKGIQVRNIAESYKDLNWCSPDSEGYFKQVYFLPKVVVQTFRHMTMYQRITEIACLMKLRNEPHMAQMTEIMYNDSGDVVGLAMERYQETLKQYAHVHSHHRLSAHQKYNIIHQMLVCIKTIHDAGLAHRDLSEVNFMVNKMDGKLEDGSDKVMLYLIDFGKSVFCDEADVRRWFVDVRREEWEYDGDVVPESKEELDSWCKALPWVKGKPDHGYRMYRSIQTLPKTRSDNQVLSWLIHPMAEDIYSIGVMIWKIFAETEPWRGILDTDLQGLRYVAEDDYRIQRAIEAEVHGPRSRELLMKCLRTQPLDRENATDILNWITQPEIKASLLEEWKMYSSETRSTRKAKTMYGFDDNEEDNTTHKRKNKNNALSITTSNGTGRGRGRGRGRGQKANSLDRASMAVPASNATPLTNHSHHQPVE